MKKMLSDVKNTGKFKALYSVDSIKRTVLLKVLSLSSILFSTVQYTVYNILDRDFLKYHEKKVREKLYVRYV